MPRWWMLQSNGEYILKGELKRWKQDYWHICQYLRDVQYLDRALLWQAGESAGIVGVGTIVHEPARCPNPDWDGIANARCIGVRYDGILPTHIGSQDPLLADFDLITRPIKRGGIFPVSAAQAQRIEPLVRELTPPLKQARNRHCPYLHKHRAP
ncbi:MAG: EVE domain-containing protein [Thermoplasmata archaeon]